MPKIWVVFVQKKEASGERIRQWKAFCPETGLSEKNSSPGAAIWGLMRRNNSADPEKFPIGESYYDIQRMDPELICISEGRGWTGWAA
jgi:hypothetical protein